VDDGRLLKVMQEASLAKKKVFTDPSTILPAIKLQRILPRAPSTVLLRQAPFSTRETDRKQSAYYV
jgi:hypothetical protein